jgi:NAD(P)-dependent dehydrogenase (short-subunit alcohol dehydrogenase family)
MAGPVLVVIGVGGMGEAVARRLGAGRPVLLADSDTDRLHVVGEHLRQAGYHAHTHQVDVGDRESLAGLATYATKLGPVTSLVHTAGLSPAQAPADKIVQVDLVGTAWSLEVFGSVIEPGGAAVYIASVAGHILGGAVEESTASFLATASPDQIGGAAIFQMPDMPDDLVRALTYGYCKRGNQLRVQYAAPAWGRRGVRVNSISPGVVATAMGWAEFNASFQHQAYEAMVRQSPAGRFGTAEDVAAAAEFLLDSSRAGFITGTDLLVDGGVVAGIRSGALSLG